MTNQPELMWEETALKTTPERYQGATWDDVPVNIQALFESIKKSRRGIFMYGGAGTGKTHIAYALHRNAKRAGVPTTIVNTVELFKEMRDDISVTRVEKTHPTDRVLANRGLLILDDLGVEKATDFVVENLYLIINKRYNDILPTIFTSNFSLDELADRVGDRIASRVVQMCDVIHIVGEDKRLMLK